MSVEAMRELKALASVCPELNMANYTEDDVRHLNDWAIEMSLLVEQYAQRPEQVPMTERELELIDGMIAVQLDHAQRCDAISNRAIAEKQKGWDMERVELLRRIRSFGITANPAEGGEDDGNPLSKRCYTMSESHLSGYRLIVGFESLGDAQAAHSWVANIGRPTPPASQEQPIEIPGCCALTTSGDLSITLRFTDEASCDRFMHDYGAAVEGGLETWYQAQKDREQAAFEAWIEANSPSGGVEAVQRQWENSSEYAELFHSQEQAHQPATPEPVQADSSEHLRVIASLGAALRRLSFAAQTTGGTAGPDAELQSAIGQAEQALSLGGIWQAMSAPGEPVKAAPYNPTEEMRRAMKRIDPALSSEQCRALWSAAWSAAPSTHPAPSVPATSEPVAWNSIQIASWIGSQLMHEPSMFERATVCKFVRSLGRHPTLLKHSPKLHPAPSVAPSIHEDNARVLQGILEEMHGMLWAPPGANIVRVLRKHIQATKDMYAALEYLSSLHPRRCLLIEVTRAREAIEQYQELFQPSAKEPS